MYGIEHARFLIRASEREAMAKRRKLMTREQTKRENTWIYIAVGVMCLILALGLYGYFTGAWEMHPQNPPPLDH